MFRGRTGVPRFQVLEAWGHLRSGRYSKEPAKEEASAHKSMAEQEEAMKNLTIV